MAVVEGARTTHTTLECRKVGESLRFYRDVMGLRVNQPAPMVGHLMDSKGHYAAVLQNADPQPQPFFNFYARPVRNAAEVDAVHERMLAVSYAYGITEITTPVREDPTRFGVGTYGFYLRDLDGNWWRVEENDGPFGAEEIPEQAKPRDSVVPAGPISYVLLESKSLNQSERFYRDFLGLDVSRPAPHYCLTRDASGWVRVISVEVGDRLVPQKVANHHGLTLAGAPEIIDDLRTRVSDSAAQFGLQKVLPATRQHGSYSFYLQDADTNCWELEIWENGVNPVLRGIEANDA
jgi:catechol 2,3-dioxygenase-like lactoylglutathione lyase family enzyme